MNEHMEAAVKAAAHRLDYEAFQSETKPRSLKLRQWRQERAEKSAHNAISAALPHIRAMIAEENIALYEQAARIADEMVARIAERKQT